jgi:hypothetical protein
MKVRLGKPGDKRCKDKIQIDSWDTWSMDMTLAKIILPMLVQLKETKHGTPCCMPIYDEHPNLFDGSSMTDEEYDRLLGIAEQQWDEILDKMIWSFTQLNLEDNGEGPFWIQHPELDLDDYPEDEGKTAIPIRWKVPGEFDMEGMKAHRIKVQEGLELFGKYFQNLWD